MCLNKLKGLRYKEWMIDKMFFIMSYIIICYNIHYK